MKIVDQMFKIHHTIIQLVFENIVKDEIYRR